MSVKASNFKNWCVDNISPQSWTRICLKCTDEIRGKGHTLKDMEDLNPDIDLDSDLLAALNKALDELYEMKFEESIM